jgi:hypothetical protein
MSDSVRMRTGETLQLRAPGGDVARWASATPTVASVTDEDLAHGRPGGLVTALREGETRIAARGFDDSVLFELTIVVDGVPLITVVAQATAPLPHVRGVSRWTSDNPRVADIAPDGQARGVSPGIALLRGVGNGTPPVDCAVHVTGTLDVEVERSVALGDFFSVPVKSWRSSVSDVSVDSKGVVHTGARPRTVEITADLENGRRFSFDLRIVRPFTPERAPEPARSVIESRHSPERGETAGIDGEAGDDNIHSMTSPAIIEPTIAAVADRQRRETEAHLSQAERYANEQDWARAGAEVTAARVAAVTDAELLQCVERRSESLRRAVQSASEEALATVLQNMADGRYDAARTNIDSMRIPPMGNPLMDGMRQLLGLVERCFTSDDTGRQVQDEAQNRVCDLWQVAVRSRFYAILPALAQIGLNLGDRVLACEVDTLGNPESAGMPTDVRRELEAHLADTGAAAVHVVADRLSNAGMTDGQSRWLLDILPGLSPRRHAAAWVNCFATADAASRARMVARLCELRVNTGNALMDLVAGVLSRLPSDPRLAQAIRKHVGDRAFEQLALKWATTGHKGAREVLERMYEYPATAFARGQT